MPDTLEDERFKANPLVTQAPFIRFFAGIALRTEAGLNLGSLCLFDQQPRGFTQAQQDQLIDLIGLVMELLEAVLPIQDNTGDITGRIDPNEACEKSREQYRTLARNIPDSVVYMFDQDFRYILAEGSILSREQVGFSKEDLEGKTIWEVLPPDNAKELALVYQKALDGQETIF